MYLSNSQLNTAVEISQQNHEQLQKLAHNLLWRTQIDYLSQWQTKPQNTDNSQTKTETDLLLVKPTISKNGKSQLVFPKAATKIYLTTNIEIPQTIEGISFKQGQIYFDVIWWAQDITIYADGEVIQQGDLLDQQACILLLDLNQINQNQDFSEKKSIKLEIILDSPHHDIGALQKSIIRYRLPHESLNSQAVDLKITGDIYQFYQELMILDQFIPKFNDAEQKILNQVLIHAENILSRDFDEFTLFKIEEIRHQLLPLAHYIQEIKIHLLGNSHIDVAWLWAIAETKEVMQRTFNSTINLQRRFPKMTFNQSTALSYAWMAEIDPDLWQSIKKMVTTNRWETIGGMWVEPDANIPSGESLIRQILYGKNYFATHFNQDVTIAWLPDTFGFNGQLPQILVNSGFTLFITQKIKWNDTNVFPHQLFWWEGIDQSRILTYFSNDIGKGTDAVEIMEFATAQMAKTQLNDVLWLYGVGDHGGGATAGMLQDLEQWEKSLFAPIINHCLAKEFGQILTQNVIETNIETNIDLPVHQGELYLEFHRGTYTTKADQKKQNRLTEIKITNTEKLLVLSEISSVSQCDFSSTIKPQINDLLTSSWQGLLLNQFHDILPGTSICTVYGDANQTWQEIDQNLNSILKIIADITEASKAKHDDIRNVNNYVYNYLNWEHSGFICVDTKIVNSLQNSFTSSTQKTAELIQQLDSDNYLLWVEQIPALSNPQLNITQLKPPLYQLKIFEYATEIILDNQLLRVTINRHLGAISQIFDHRLKQNLLHAPSTLQFFQDTGQYWDAWNIDPNYEQFLLDLLIVNDIQIIESGPLRLAVKIITQFQDSIFTQTIYLDAFRPIVTVSNSVEWQEQNVLVKVAFPLNWQGSSATYDIPMGTIDRSTLAENSIEKAKFEVPAQLWANLSDDPQSIGLSIINDCKYGYDAKPDQLRLTLLRSPQWPCPNADTGHHEFTYQMVPHSGSWRDVNIPHLAYELNNPLHLNKLPQVSPFLEITAPNIILTALKPAENGRDYIIRVYETFGIVTNCQFMIKPRSGLAITSIELCDLLENPHTTVSYFILDDGSYQFTSEFSPYQILSFVLQISQRVG